MTNIIKILKKVLPRENRVVQGIIKAAKKTVSVAFDAAVALTNASNPASTSSPGVHNTYFNSVVHNHYNIIQKGETVPYASESAPNAQITGPASVKTVPSTSENAPNAQNTGSVSDPTQAGNNNN